MKGRDAFQKLREQQFKLGLRGQLTLLIGAIVLVSIMVSLLILYLLKKFIPVVDKVPPFIQLIILGVAIAILVARFVMKFFSDPIQKLRQGMRRVADGDFRVQLTTKSTAGEIKELFAGFNMMVEELQSTEILQTDFVSNVSHEFKTPINAIEGYTTLLQNTDNIDEVENYYIDKILFNTKRLSSLVSNILLLSKIENQSIPTNREKYRLDEQIREAIVALEPAWEPKNIEFDVEMAEITYYGNENLLYHVWTNLMSNAIKFSPQSGKVKICLYSEENIYFVIEDCGPGLSPEAEKHIFDKFYQEDTSHKEEGNGLGLALVKHILSITDGEVSAENLPEGGCRFTVKLKSDNL